MTNDLIMYMTFKSKDIPLDQCHKHVEYNATRWCNQLQLLLTLKKEHKEVYNTLLSNIWEFIYPLLEVGYVYDENRKMFDITNVYYYQSYLSMHLVTWMHGTYKKEELYDMAEEIILLMVDLGLLIFSESDDSTNKSYNVCIVTNEISRDAIYSQYDFNNDEEVSFVDINISVEESSLRVQKHFDIYYEYNQVSDYIYSPEFEPEKIYKIMLDGEEIKDDGSTLSTQLKMFEEFLKGKVK